MEPLVMSMMAGANILADLSEYTVTEKKFRQPGDPLPQMKWFDYRKLSAGIVEFTLGGNAKVYMHAPRPTEYEVVADGNVLIWNDDPDYVPDV